MPPGLSENLEKPRRTHAAAGTYDHHDIFHAALGPAGLEARLRHLRDLWAEALRDHPGIEILTPEDKRMSVGITSFRLKGRTGTGENTAIAKALLEKYRIFTVHRTSIAKGTCVRVTPALFNSEEDVLSLRRALTELAQAKPQPEDAGASNGNRVLPLSSRRQSPIWSWLCRRRSADLLA